MTPPPILARTLNRHRHHRHTSCTTTSPGAIICGTVDGNRMWGKDLKKTELTHVQWSPDSKQILFGTATGELQLYDGEGTFLTKLPSYCNEGAALTKIAAIAWYNGANGYTEGNVPCLAVCYENGRIQILRNETDTAPVLLNTGMRRLQMKWNNNGSILAVSGTQSAAGTGPAGSPEEKESCSVIFYTPLGRVIRALKVPGTSISSLTWYGALVCQGNGIGKH
jgi:WD repeat-containing protein 35